MTLRGLKSRLLRLEREAKRTDVPTPEEYWVATGRETARRLRRVYESLARIPSLDGSPAPHPLRGDRDSVLAGDTPEQAEADRRVVVAWERAHGKADIRSRAGEAKARLLAMRRE